MMGKEDVVKVEYYSAMRKNGFESVLVTWMSLEPVTE